VSQAPSAAHFRDAMSVDDKRQARSAEGAIDPAVVSAPRGRAPAQYYARIYREYINAKKALGEQTDHITEQAFAARIQGMEQDAPRSTAARCATRCTRGTKKVVLLAVPRAAVSAPLAAGRRVIVRART
jgi:hypothetical protein